HLPPSLARAERRAADLYPPLARRDETEDDLHHGGFAGAVVAEQCHPFARGDGDAHVREGGNILEPLSETRDRQGRSHRSCLSPSAPPRRLRPRRRRRERKSSGVASAGGYPSRPRAASRGRRIATSGSTARRANP